MLKILPPAHVSQQAKVKCGEIFSNSFTDYTIYCTFCNMKSFKFEDFLQHIQNVHFESNLLKTETINMDCNQFLEVNVKNENIMEGKKVLWDDLEQSYDEDDIDNYDSNGDNSTDEGPVAILKKTEKNVLTRKRKKPRPKNGSDNEDNDHSSNEDFKTVSNESKNSARVDLKKPSKNSELLKPIKTRRVQDEKSELKSMKKGKEVTEHPCPECEEIFIHLKLLDRHVYDFHGGYKCSKCDKRFRRRPHLVGHEKTHTAEKKFTCPVEECGRGFTEEEYLKRHLEVHTMERTFICDFENCGKAFHTKRRLNTHTYTHRIPKKLVCDLCGYSCRGNNELLTHQRVHTGEKPFPCEVCEKPFISKTALKEHMITHSTTRPHVCQICNASFANPRVLIRHTYIHSDEKTFKCKLCDSAFKHPNSLDGHMRRMHRPTKPKQSAVTVTSSSFTFN